MSAQSQTEAHRLTSCVGKIRHESKADAASAMRNVFKRKGKKPGEVTEPYRCDYCDGWHFGHPMSKAKK